MEDELYISSNKKRKCPFCNSDELIYSYIITNVEDNVSHRGWICENCGKTGEEWYRLAFIGHNVYDSNNNIVDVSSEKLASEDISYEFYFDILSKLLKRDISLLDLEIVNEIDCTLDRDCTSEEKNMLLSKIRGAYLKSSDLSVEEITKCAVDNLDRLEDMTYWDLIRESC